MRESLGIIEVAGLAGAITVADVMVKAANVEIVGIEPARGLGWMTVKVIGDVGAVQAAIETGISQAELMKLYCGSKVIPRPATDIDSLFLKPPVTPADSVDTCEVVTTEPVQEVVSALTKEEASDAESIKEEIQHLVESLGVADGEVVSSDETVVETVKVEESVVEEPVLVPAKVKATPAKKRVSKRSTTKKVTKE